MHGYLFLGAGLTLATALPLGWKWQLGIARVAVAVLAGSMLMASVLTAVNSFVDLTAVIGTLAMWGATLAACLMALLALFFRDPDRAVPGREDVIVSPADGRVVYVRPVRPGEVPVAEKKGRACLLAELRQTGLADAGAVAVGISMNLLDVHVNRAPLAGGVRLVEHVRGTFGSLRNPEMLLSNERATMVIESDGVEVALVQIASRLVRRIVTFASKGDAVGLGQRIGAIRFGSQVDLLIPERPDIRLTVQPGDRLVAGRTVVAVITSRARRAAAEAPGGAAGRSSEPVMITQPARAGDRHVDDARRGERLDGGA
jgi:phosphatidylserine decarboxylase